MERKMFEPIPVSRVQEIANEEDYKNEIKDEPDFILEEFAIQVAELTKHKYEGRVVEIVDEDGAVTYSLYIISYEVGEITYKLAEATIKSIAKPYPVTAKLFAIDQQDIQDCECIDAQTYRNTLKRFFQSEATGKIMGQLDHRLMIRRYERSKSA